MPTKIPMHCMLYVRPSTKLCSIPYGHPASRWKRPRADATFRRSSSSDNAHKSSPPSPLRNPLQWYASKLDTHPLTTKCISSGIIAGSGDLLCQRLHSTKNPNSTTADAQNDAPLLWNRTLRFALLGSFLVAPAIHAWYGFLMTRIPGSSLSAASRRLFLDQALFAPAFLPVFLSCLALLEHVSPDADRTNDRERGDPVRRWKERLRKDVPEALAVGWAIWIPSMGFMFAVVPSKFQVLFSNAVGFLWNAYLSWRTHEGGR